MTRGLQTGFYILKFRREITWTGNHELLWEAYSSSSGADAVFSGAVEGIGCITGVEAYNGISYYSKGISIIKHRYAPGVPGSDAPLYWPYKF